MSTNQIKGLSSGNQNRLKKYGHLKSANRNIRKGNTENLTIGVNLNLKEGYQMNLNTIDNWNSQMPVNKTIPQSAA